MLSPRSHGYCIHCVHVWAATCHTSRRDDCGTRWVGVSASTFSEVPVNECDGRQTADHHNISLNRQNKSTLVHYSTMRQKCIKSIWNMSSYILYVTLENQIKPWTYLLSCLYDNRYIDIVHDNQRNRWNLPFRCAEYLWQSWFNLKVEFGTKNTFSGYGARKFRSQRVNVLTKMSV